VKERISITLPWEVLEQVDRLSGEESRCAFIERVLRGYFTPAASARDLERINRAADRLNAEVADVLQYQAGSTLT